MVIMAFNLGNDLSDLLAFLVFLIILCSCCALYGIDTSVTRNVEFKHV